MPPCSRRKLRFMTPKVWGKWRSWMKPDSTVKSTPAPSRSQISREPHMSWFAASMNSFKELPRASRSVGLPVYAIGRRCKDSVATVGRRIRETQECMLLERLPGILGLRQAVRDRPQRHGVVPEPAMTAIHTDILRPRRRMLQGATPVDDTVGACIDRGGRDRRRTRQARQQGGVHMRLALPAHVLVEERDRGALVAAERRAERDHEANIVLRQPGEFSRI